MRTLESKPCISKEYAYGDNGVGGPDTEGQDAFGYEEWASQHIQDDQTACEQAEAWIARGGDLTDSLDFNDDPRENVFECYTVTDKDTFLTQYHAAAAGRLSEMARA